MAYSDFVAQRTRREWVLRVILAFLAALLGYVGVAQSLADLVVKSDPVLARKLAPHDGRTAAALANKYFVDQPNGDPTSRAAQLARLALRQDPTAVLALVTLGLQAQLRGDASGARQWFAYSQQLSRRDLQTQLWAIEDSVGRGDIASALRHYDIALRTTDNAADLLFPVLLGAMAQPDIRQNLVRTLLKRPTWAPGFISYVAAKGARDPKMTAGFFLALYRGGMPLTAETIAAGINGLLATGASEDAWRFYTTIRGAADRRTSRDPRFTAEPDIPSGFDWNPVNDANIVTSIQRGKQGGVFEFSLPTSVGGALLQQTQLLPPGTYRLEGHSNDIDQPAQSLPYWALFCRNGRELGRVSVPPSVRAGGSFIGQFSVRADCPVQTLVLIARASDNVDGVSGQIDRVLLSPVP